YLLEHKPWDCFMILFGESDLMGHQLWKYCDPHSPLFSRDPAGLQDGLLKIYQELDRQTGELIARLPGDTTVLLSSDHGFGGVSNWMLYPNCWLNHKGFLRFRGRVRHRMSRILNKIKLWGMATTPGWLRKLLFRFAGGSLARLEAGVRFGMIDW